MHSLLFAYFKDSVPEVASLISLALNACTFNERLRGRPKYSKVEPSILQSAWTRIVGEVARLR
jgi:hypothetical protein